MVDVAKLVFDFDATSATAAEQKITSLEKASARLDQAAARTKSAFSGGAFDQARNSAGAYEKSVRNLVGAFEQGRDALGRYIGTDGAFRMSQEATAKVLLQNAKATEAMTREQNRAAAEVARLTASYDPLAGTVAKTNNELSRAQQAYEKGRISAEQYGTITTGLSGKLANLQKAHASAGAGAKLQSFEMINLGRQLSDLGVQIASGQGILMPLIQQGPQVADVFQTAAARGVGFKAALAGIAAEITPLLPLAGALTAVAAAAGTVAVGVKRNLDNEAAVRAFTGQLTLNTDGLNYNAQALASTSKELSRFGLSAADASAGLSTFVSAGVDASKLRDYSVAAKSLSEVSAAFRDVKSAQEAVSDAFTGGFDAVDALDKKLNFLTVAQYEHVKAMFASGQASEAQAEAFSAFAAKVDEAADKARGPWQTAVNDLSGAWNGLLDNFANTGAIQGATVALETLMGRVAAALKMSAPGAGQASEVPAFMRAGATGSNLDLFGTVQRLGLQRQREDFLRNQADGLRAIATPGGGDSPAQKAYLGVIDALNLQLDQTKKINDAERVRLASEKAATDALAKGVTGETRLTEIRRKAGEIEQAKIDREKASTARTGAAAATRAFRLDDTTQDALDRAQKAELAAQQALTQNIDMLAGYRKQQVEQEAEAARANVDREVAAKKLDAATAPAIKAVIDRTEALKKQAIDQQYASQLVDKEVQQRAALASFSDRTLQAQIGMATSLEETQALEEKALAARQAREWADAKAQERKDQLNGTFDAEATKAANGARMEAQAAERAVKARNDRLAIFGRDLEIARQVSQNEAAILSSRKDLAQSAYEAAQLDRRIEAVQYAARKDELAKIIANTDVDDDKHGTAIRDLATLEAIHANNLRSLDLSANMATAYADLVGALSDAARAVIDGDIGGSISAAGGVLRQLSGLAGSGTALGASLATAASYAGPIGAAVSAVTGVLGAIGDKSAAKAQAKIEALTKSVDALRAENKTSSGSIAAALSEANANWNSDLEYSSAMLTALRSIDAKTGAAAALLARQVGTGGLLGTDGLGLGSSTSQGGLGGALSGGLVGGIAGAGIGAAATAATGLLMSGFAGAATALAGPFGLAIGAAGALVKALMKTKVTTEVLDQGLNFTAATFDQIMSGGVTGSTYADLLTTKKKSLLGIGLSTKVNTSTVNGSINSDLLGQISGVIQALGDGVLSAASVFGVEAAKAAESALGSAVVDLGKLSLKDLKPDEIADVLNATFDKVGDQLAAAGVPGLDKLADVGEGAFETLTRVAREYQVVDVALQSIGKTFGQVGLESIAARDELVKLFGGADAFTSATSFFGQNFLTDAERLAPIIGAVNDNLKAFGLSAESSRDAFKNLVLAQDLTTEAGRNTYAALLSIAPAFDKVASASEDAAAKLLADQQRLAEEAAAKAKERADIEAANMATNIGLQRQLMAMDDAVLGTNVVLLAQRADELAKLDDTGKALQKLLWAREDEAAAMKLQADRQSALADLYDAQGRTAEATALRRAQALAAITDPLQRAYQEMTYAATDAAQKVTDARSVLTDAYNAEKSAIEATKSKLVDLVKTLRDYSGSLSSQALDALDPIAKRNATLSAFQDAATRARLGDSEAAALIPKLGEEFRTASEAAASSQIDYLRDLSYIRRATDDAADTAERQVSAADRQLEALNASVAGLININQSVISVQQAIANLTAATIAANAAGVVSVGGSDLGLGGALSTDPKSATGYNAQTAYFLTHGMAGAAGGGDPAYVALGNAYKPSFGDVANVYGVAEALRQQQAGLVKFASGGVFTNGVVSQPTTFDMGMMGEAGPEAIVPLVQGPDGLGVRMSGGNDNSALVAELRALRKEVSELKAAQVQTTINTARTTRQLERWDGDGLPPERDVA